MLAQFGIELEENGEGYFVRGRQRYRSPGTLGIEGDWSSAAFFLAAGALGREVGVKGLRPDSAQGDRAIVELLRRFGAKLLVENDTVYAAGAKLKGCTVDVSDIPDLLPVLAVLAAQAEGRSEFVHAEHLRGKESDRLASTAAMITALGGRADAYPDRLTVMGGRLSGGTVESFGDHRIVMAAAVAASVCLGRTVIRGAQAAAKSYPGFFRDFAVLGGNIISEGDKTHGS
jgi:3-phosphoshikimate 1-carboxyvinyltransferase